jgi:hypothetical protein
MNREDKHVNLDDVPKHLKKAKKKPFGIEYFRRWSLGGWTSHHWYPTEKARDQAYDNLVAKVGGISRSTICHGVSSDIRKVER